MNKIGQLDGIVAVSVATRTFHLAHGLAAPKFIVIHNGVAAVDSTRTCDWSIRSELDLPERSRLILNAGQIGLRKAQHTLIEAFSLISKEFPDCFLILAGERNSTKQESIEFEAKLECLARSPALRERVHLVGFVPDLAKMMPQFDLLVHTARQEPFGRVLLEASAGGIPIVATDVGGTREIITPGASGLLVPADDPHATAAAMRRLLTSSDLSTSYALAARADVLERFSVESSAEAMRAFWKELARTGR